MTRRASNPSSWIRLGGAYQIDNHLSDLIRSAFLYEVAATFDGGVWESLGAGYLLQKLGFSTAGDWVVVGKRTQERFVEGFEKLPSLCLLL